MIVISSPIVFENEVFIVRDLFQEGMERFHVRKPNLSIQDIEKLIENIGLEYIDRMVFHHFSSEKIYCRNKHVSNCKELNFNLLEGEVFSTSTHSIEEFNELSKEWNYAFLSPVFESISKKGYGKNSDLLKAISCRTNFSTKMVALGGIQEENIKIVLDAGFDSVAIMGNIWLSDNPIKKFKKCQQIVLSY